MTIEPQASQARKDCPRAAAWLVTAFALLASLPMASAIVPWTNAINTNFVVNVLNYGAVGDGVTTNSVAISNAITAAVAGGTTNGLTGGTVLIPAGIFLSGPLNLKNFVNLQVASNGTLRMLPLNQYPTPWVTNANGSYHPTNTPNFITGSSVHDIMISGPGGIDGQGLPWWPWANTNGASRPIMIRLNSCNRQMIQNITLSNSPEFHISLSGSGVGNSTVQNVTIRANPSSDPVNPGHNTDACDVVGTNVLVQFNDISTGDDNFTCGGNTWDVLIVSNTYGYGHGVSIGSFTSPGVSNITVINCTFTNTEQGIRIKSDRDRGGLVQNINYLNLTMANVLHPILVYCQYTNTNSIYRAVDSISPAVAAGYASSAITSKTPAYRNITISNVTATTASSRGAGLIWGLPEMPMTNITLIKVKITADKPFGIFEAQGVRFIDSQVISPAGINNLALFNTQLTISNSVPTNSVVTLDGTCTNAIGNGVFLYGSGALLRNTNALATNPIVLVSSGTFTISNHLDLNPSTSVTFVLGSNAATMAVRTNLALNTPINVTNGNGFTAGSYVIFTYGGTLSGTPVLGTKPTAFPYSYSLNTATAGQVKLVATDTNAAPSVTTNTLQSSANPSIYGNQVTLTSTVAPAPTNGEIVTFKDGAATLGTGTLSAGQAAFTTAAAQLAAGTHPITAVYGGDGAYLASTSSILSQVVSRAGTSVSVNSSATPAAHLSPVTFTAHVLSASASGTVLFRAGGVAFDTEGLSGGAATSVPNASLPRGTNTIAAEYSGDPNYLPSTNTLSQVVTNNPPVTTPASYYRVTSYPLQISITNLATHWSDADSDTLSLATVNSSTNGAPVTFDALNIYYANSNAVPDQFGYMIDDGNGGAASGVVNIDIAEQRATAVRVNGDGTVTLDFLGIPGSTYWTEASTNLPDTTGWVSISTNLANGAGFYECTDSQAANFLQRFYRSHVQGSP